MSVSSEDAFDQDDIAKVLELATEPSYVSEIARKLEELDDMWRLTGTRSVEKVAIIVSMLSDRNDVVMFRVGYGDNTEGQAEASPIDSLTDQEEEGMYRWNKYSIIHYTGDVDVREEFKGHVDQDVGADEKAELVEMLSGDGNRISKAAEDIMQDTMERQFKHYEEVTTPGYNDPGLDFHVEDERNRDWGLAIEVSVRWVNQIGSKYLESKKEKAFDRDSDLLIMAPRFTQELLEEYENPENPKWHSDPLDQMVHLHTVPTMEPDVYFPFANKPEEVNERETGGNPVIVPDSEEARRRLKDRGNIGGGYPVVDDDFSNFRQALEGVFREFTVITESRYRNEVREAIEPLLWEFLRPYKVEQFLQDMYWDEQLTQKEIGKLVGRTADTIGEWMRRWGVMRRGGGAPELSDETVEIWKRMYEGKRPFKEEFSGYRIQAEYNRHPLWGLEDWEEWYNNTTEEEREQVMAEQSGYAGQIEYTLMFNPSDRLMPSYKFIIDTLKDAGVEVRDPDLAPRVPYNAYPSKDALEYMLNRDQDTIVEVSNNGQ